MAYWHVPHPVGNQIDLTEINGFYIDFSEKINFNGLIDEEIPKVFYGNKYYFNPITICQYALGHYERYLKNKQNSHLEIFLTQAEWLAKNCKRGKGGCSWEFGFNFKPYKLKAPWISAMAQGEAIAVLIRASKYQNRDKYLQLSKEALKPFFIHIANGGVRSKVKGRAFYEEYPSANPAHVLNGFIYSLFGILDYTIETKSEDSKELFEEGIDSLVNVLPEYDTGRWSKYDLSEKTNVSSIFYHQLHINQLKVLYKITGIKLFDDYAERWNEYLKSPVNRGVATIKKAYLKLLG